MNQYYVYELIDPRDSSVFYVGKGMRNRVDAHEKEAERGRVSRKCDRIRDILTQGGVVGKRIVQRFGDEQEAYDFEVELIARHGLSNLTNVAIGGGTSNGLREDRSFIIGASEMVNRTKNGAIRWLFVAGQPVDLCEILAGHIQRVEEIAKRRGIDWVNSLSATNNVRYDYG